MNELEAVVQAAHEAWERGQPALLATVVGVRGSAYRRPGARMLITPDGWRAGSISGGCLEGDLVRKAWWRTRDNQPVILTYDSTLAEDSIDADELSWGFGLGCNGVVEVLLERLAPGDAACPVGFIAECLRRRRPGVMATVIGGEEETNAFVGQRLLWHSGNEQPAAHSLCDAVLSDAVASEASCLLSDNTPSRTLFLPTASGRCAHVYLERILPPTPLLICGAGHDTLPLAQLAKTLGWHVTVVDPRAGMTPRADRFPGVDAVLSCPPADLANRVTLDPTTAVVVMSHNVVQDAALLAALLPSPVRYIGMLGPRKRTERLLESLGETGSDDCRLHGPVGLDIGADNPETIALSILAEIQAFIAQRSAGSLRDSDQPIHKPTFVARERDFSPRETVTCSLMTVGA